MSKILIVEDDQFFREAVCDLLKKKSYEVFEAGSGQAALELILKQEFDLVLSDIQMPGMTGIELLTRAKAAKPELPFILMTGFSMLLETQSAYEMGAKEFITKPFKNNELLGLIEKVVAEKKNSSKSTVHLQDFSKVAIDEFVMRPKIEYDLYIKLSPVKIIKIAHQGDELDHDRLDHYKVKGVKHLYILNKDYRKFIERSFNLNLINAVRSETALQKKANLMERLEQVNFTQSSVSPSNQEIFDEALAYLKISCEVLADSDAYLDLLTSLSAQGELVFNHSVMVSIFSLMITQRMGLESSPVLSKVCLAALFHSLGKTEFDRAISQNEEVAQIISEHQEDMMGQKDIHPLSKIVQCAKVFVLQTVPNSGSPALPAEEALVYIDSTYGDKLNAQCLSALKSLFENRP